MSSAWTDELRKEVCGLWGNNSATQIMGMLSKRGHTFSRNAIIGVIHRAGFSVRQKSQVHPMTRDNGVKRPKVFINVEEINRERLRKARPPIIPTPFVCADITDVKPLNISLLDLQEGDCRFPYDGKDGEATTYCGHPAITAQSWCKGHCKVVFQPRQQRKSHSLPEQFGKHRGGVFGRVA